MECVTFSTQPKTVYHEKHLGVMQVANIIAQLFTINFVIYILH